MKVNSDRRGPLSLRTIQQELVALLRARGREDLVQQAFDRVGYTDDGTTLYVHILPKAFWFSRGVGRAYVLAFADRDQLTSLGAHRALLGEARLLLNDEIDDIARWFDGR